MESAAAEKAAVVRFLMNRIFGLSHWAESRPNLSEVTWCRILLAQKIFCLFSMWACETAAAEKQQKKAAAESSSSAAAAEAASAAAMFFGFLVLLCGLKFSSVGRMCDIPDDVPVVQ